MKTSKLQKFAWVFFVLALTTTTVFAQVRGNGNRNFQNQNGTCLNNISGLTEKQQEQISEMGEQHLEAMAELRAKRQSTTNAIEKSEIRTEMLKKVEAHRTSVKNVLTADQKKQYEQLNARGSNSGNRNGNGFRNGGKNGTGNQQFAQGNRGGCNRNQAGMKQGNRNNNRQNGSGCRGNKNRGNNGNGRGNGNRVNSSNS